VIGARLLHFYVPTFLAHVPEEAPPVSTDSAHPGRKRQAGATYLPDLDRFLPHSWIDQALVSDKAVKDDDADTSPHVGCSHYAGSPLGDC
jgi:hypothetical protein